MREVERGGGFGGACSHFVLSPPLPLLWRLVEHTHTHTPAELPTKQQKARREVEKKDVTQPHCAIFCSEFSRAHHELLLFWQTC